MNTRIPGGGNCGGGGGGSGGGGGGDCGGKSRSTKFGMKDIAEIAMEENSAYNTVRYGRN